MQGYDSSEVISMKLTIEMLTEVAENLENQAVTVRSIVSFLDGILQNLKQEEANVAHSMLRIMNEQLSLLKENATNSLYDEIDRDEIGKILGQSFKIGKMP